MTAEEYVKHYASGQGGYESVPVDIALRAIEYAKQEAKEQMTANTADAMIGLPYENKDGGYTHLIDVSRPLPVGYHKIALIFKEDCI